MYGSEWGWGTNYDQSPYHQRRNYRPILVTAPTETPITSEEAVLHLRIDTDDEDSLVDGLIDAAVAYLDGWTGRLGKCLVTQTWKQQYDLFAQRMRLPLDPVQSIASVKYQDINNATQTISSSNYQLLIDERGPYVEFNYNYTLPITYAQEPPIVIQFVVGYGSADQVPNALKQAMLLLIANWYKNREAVLDGYRVELLPGGVEALLAPFTRPKF
jgi:uncharacterized phiE125 gp8 family phage protein